MDGNEKAVVFTTAIIFGVIFLIQGVSAYTETQCKIAAIQRNVSAEDIVKLCKSR
jgi:hypothetical protein